MARTISAKCKQCRREGAKLFLKGERCFSSKCAIVKRNFVPGLHGPKLGKGGGRLTGYGIQLREKQKTKRIYKILEKQFSNYFDKAMNQPGDTGTNFYCLLETRLDSVLYRAGFFSSRDLARQMITHGHIRVNGKKLDIPSYAVKVKDKITIKPGSMKLNAFKDLAEKQTPKEYADWIVVDPKELTVTLVDLPNFAKVTPEFDLKVVTEFYSR